MKYPSKIHKTVEQHTKQGDWLGTLATLVNIVGEKSLDPNFTDEDIRADLFEIRDMILLTNDRFVFIPRNKSSERYETCSLYFFAQITKQPLSKI